MEQMFRLVVRNVVHYQVKDGTERYSAGERKFGRFDFSCKLFVQFAI